MNLIAAISTLLPAAPSSGVAAIVAGVRKSAGLIEAESALAENSAAEVAATKRLSEIAERLDIKSSLRTIFKDERDALESERSDLRREADERRSRAVDLRRLVAELMPEYARSVSVALSTFRRLAAEQLIDAVLMAEEAMTDIAISNRALLSVGFSPPGAFALPYSVAARELAYRILKETARG
jgi:hypothetical protein